MGATSALIGPAVLARGIVATAIGGYATVLLQVVLLTYVIMPRVTRLLGGWLFRR
ncbi:MAG: hypothetical protein ABI548_04835 [Polyangiaceae bacterium]